MTGPRVLLLAVMSNWMFQNLIPSLRRRCAHVCAYPFGNFMSTVGEEQGFDISERFAVGSVFLSQDDAAADAARTGAGG